MTDVGSESGAERHRILRELRQQLEQHPAVEAAWGEPEGSYAEVVASVNPSFFGRETETATLRLVWYPAPTYTEDESDAHGDGWIENPRTHFEAMFKLHYSESSGYDCGFYIEPNPHVEGWFHFQERDSPDTEYEYEPSRLDARSPVSALWELLDLLEERLTDVS
ncbi:hypothetical protein [Haladaptatus sp. ZSTT2]|uniref:hypothetical protein n=1 Tax=Haladaptatus sp. ZSTT2 TaxID=3120515 RepID=UPI00300F5915